MPSLRGSRVALALMAFLFALVGDIAARQAPQQANLRDLVGREFAARVVHVGDGDSLEVVLAGESRPLRIRLEGIDAPEQGEVFGAQALAHLRTLVFDQQVRLRGRDVDRYNRLVARVLINGTDASVAMVRAGLACHAYAFDQALAREEADARRGGAGFWAASAAKPACVTRTAFSAPRALRPPSPQASDAAAAELRGNVNSRVYHRSTCKNYNCRNCTAIFRTETDAQAAGYRPAGDCFGRDRASQDSLRP